MSIRAITMASDGASTLSGPLGLGDEFETGS
jgi:hypothetical protein